VSAEILWKRSAHEERIADFLMILMSVFISGKMGNASLVISAKRPINQGIKKILRQTDLNQAPSMDQRERILRILSHRMSQQT
jgi:hypothetical protein